MEREQETVIRLHAPRVDGQTVQFSWDAENDDGFYKRNDFKLEFPDTVDISRVPEGLWLRTMFACLHCHWVLLRPCRVEVPRTLPPGEREFWLRMIDASVWTFEFDRTDDADVAALGAAGRARDTRRSVTLVDYGPPAGEMTAPPSTGTVVNCFSGGRDSLAQAGLLAEMGFTPILVTTVSHREGSSEFQTERFAWVLEETGRRLGAESVVVNSDLRTCCENFHPRAAQYAVAVTEITDTFLYFSTGWAVAWARGASHVFLAGEAEVQENLRVDGGVVQIEHYAYSAVAQRALTELAAPTGIEYSSLISALEHFQVHRLLGSRYPELRGLQYSCYSQEAGQDVCSECYSCFKTAMYLISEGISPSEVKLDVDAALSARGDWEPLGPRSSHATGTAARRYAARLDNQLVRVLRDLDKETVESFMNGEKLSSAGRAGLARLKATAAAAPDPTPEPGYRAVFVELHDEPVRGRLDAILSEHFEPSRSDEFGEMHENTLLLGDWLAAPLRI